MTIEDRYRLALERIVGLEHDESCTTKMCPLYECGCYEKGPHDLAQMALDGVDWAPSPRKTRALQHFVDSDVDDPDHPFWRRRRLILAILTRLDENAFAGKSLLAHSLEDFAVASATEAELNEFQRLDALEASS